MSSYSAEIEPVEQAADRLELESMAADCLSVATAYWYLVSVKLKNTPSILFECLIHVAHLFHYLLHAHAITGRLFVGRMDNSVIFFFLSLCFHQSNLSTEMAGNCASDKQLFIQTANYKVGQSRLRALSL